MHVLGFGEGSVDFVHGVAELPRVGIAKLPLTSQRVSCGGQVATAMAACAALGLHASYLGPVGTDDNGRRLLAALTARGVDVSRVIVREAATRFAVILVEEVSGERLVLWNRDERLDLEAEALTPALVSGAAVVHVDGVDVAASSRLARVGREAGAIVTCDIDNVDAGALLEQVTMPILAEGLPERLSGVADLEASLRALRKGHHTLIAVTLGARGSAALAGDEFVLVPAVPVQPVDTTGAGDIFRAGCIYATLQGWPPERSLRFANAAAAVSCTRGGAIASVPSLAEVLALL